MLHLKKITDPVNETMESDFYVPIKVKFNDWDNYRGHLYLGIGTNGLLELGLERTTGLIGEVTLVSVSKIIVRNKQNNTHNIIKKKGRPSFITKKWNPDDYYYLKEPHNFNIYQENNCMLIELIPHKITSLIINDRFAFGFDKDNLLCIIEFRNMTTEEQTLLDERYGNLKSYE